jgi:DNA-directed RNA polymerase specialized sigma24 family protein
VRAPREDIEDACAFAWLRFLQRQPDRDQAWKGWLVTVAKHEAWKLNARHLETQAIVGEDELEFGTTLEPADPRDRLETVLEFHAAMEELRGPEKVPPILFYARTCALRRHLG